MDCGSSVAFNRHQEAFHFYYCVLEIARCPELPWTRALTCLNGLCQPSPLRNLFLPVDSAKLAGREGGGLTNLQWLVSGLGKCIKLSLQSKTWALVSLTKEPASRRQFTHVEQLWSMIRMLIVLYCTCTGMLFIDSCNVAMCSHWKSAHVSLVVTSLWILEMWLP